MQIHHSPAQDKTVISWNLEQSVELDKVVAVGCDWVRDYLRTNTEVEESEHHLCDGIGTVGANTKLRSKP